MTATLVVLLDLAIVIALCVSIVQFWRQRWLGAPVLRKLAALSALITLVVFVLIYSGSFLHESLAALRHWGVDPSVRKSVLDFIRPFDEACTDVVNAINGVIGAGEVGYRPEPPAWPGALLVFGYGIRFLIYRFHTRNGNFDSALTGATYWSYITAYVMVLAYLIVLARFDAVSVVLVSLALITVIVISVKVFFEDFGLTVRAIARTVWTEVSRAASRVAILATEVAALVREALAYANRFYLDRIRKPLRRGIDALEARNVRTRREAEERLAEQNAQHARRFGSSKPPGEEPGQRL